MKSGFRQTMAVLHTWVGLVAGWVLMAIFVGGTLSVFAHPLTAWMRQESQQTLSTLPDVELPEAVATAARFLRDRKPAPSQWRIVLPDETDSAIRVWMDADHATRLHPKTGALLPEPPQEDEALRERSHGGELFVALHYSLHAGTFGIYLVGLATMAMLLALVTGVIVHKRIFADIFTLRLGKGQRSWLDGHNVASVLTLPFQFVIGFSGLAIFHAVWMPAAVWFHFGLSTPEQTLNRDGPYFAAIDARSEARSPRFVALGKGDQLAFSSLPSLAVRAQELSGQPLLWLARDADERGQARLRVAVRADPLVGLPPGEERVYAVEDVDGPLVAELRREASAADATLEVLSEFHMLGFGGAPARWLWFLCGIAGCVMTATGLILFTVKRRARAAGPEAASVLRVIDALNVASVAGIVLASIAFLWINRILPLDVEGRADLEVDGFLVVWALSPLYALWRRGRAWRELFGLTALLCLLLPVLNLTTTGSWLGAYVARGEWSLGAVEAVALSLGAAFASIAAKRGRSA